MDIPLISYISVITSRLAYFDNDKFLNKQTKAFKKGSKNIKTRKNKAFNKTKKNKKQ